MKNFIMTKEMKKIKESISLVFQYQLTTTKKGVTTTVWKADPAKLAMNKLIKAFPNLIYYEGEWLNHLDGYLHPVPTKQLKKYLMAKMGKVMSLIPKHLDNIIKLLEIQLSINIIDHESRGVPFSNVIFPSKANKAYRKWHNIEYTKDVKDADIKLFLDYIEKLVPKVESREKLLSYLCYLLIETKDIQQMLIMVGDRKVGKTILTKLIEDSVPSFNTSIEDVIKDKDMAYNMRSAYAVIFDEIRDLNLDTKAGEMIKKWVTADTLTTRAIYKGTTTGTFYSRFVLTCNNLPYSNYIESAFFDRICLVKCEKSYTGDPVPGFERQLIDIKDKIFSWIYDNYIKKYVKILGARSGMTRADYNIHVDAFNKFLENSIEISDEMTTLNDIYQVYCLSTDDPLAKNVFARRLKKNGYDSERRMDNGKKTTMYFADLKGISV